MAAVSAVRAQIAARLLALGVLLHESAEPIEMIRASTRSPMHLEFAVGTDTETFGARGAQSRTAIQVVIPYHLESKDRIDGDTGYNAMLDVERVVVAGLRATQWATPRLASLTPITSRREPGIDGWIWLVITTTALHPTA